MNCESKGRYPSKTRAELAIKKRCRQNPTLFLRSYYCKECGGWHLTHQPDRFRKDDVA